LIEKGILMRGSECTLSLFSEPEKYQRTMCVDLVAGRNFIITHISCM